MTVICATKGFGQCKGSREHSLNAEAIIQQSVEDLVEIIAELQHAVRSAPFSLGVRPGDAIAHAVPVRIVHEFRVGIHEVSPVEPPGSQDSGDSHEDFMDIRDVASSRPIHQVEGLVSQIREVTHVALDGDHIVAIVRRCLPITRKLPPANVKHSHAGTKKGE
jgi:hypothetical protein